MLERSSTVKCLLQTKKAAPWGTAQTPTHDGRLVVLGLILPASLSGLPGDFGAFLGAEGFGPRLPADKAPTPSKSDGSGVFATGAGSLTSGDSDDASRPLVGVLWTQLTT